MTVHLVYPWGKRRAAPWSIGNHLAEYLRKDGYEVKQYDWEERVRFKDVDFREDWIIGHPHEKPGYAFTDNLFQFNEAQSVAIAPFNGSPDYNFRLRQVENSVAYIFGICGPGFQDKLPLGYHRLDIAINPDHYPPLKTEFNPPGQRKFLYIGCTLECKGTPFLSEVIHECPREWHFGHVGPGIVPGTWPWGYVEMESEKGQGIVSEYDVVVSLGAADANPTTMLEALSWGLVPVCTYESGWSGGWLHRVSYGDVTGAVKLLTRLQNADTLTVDRTPLKSYTWERFYQPIRECLGNHGCSKQDQKPD